MMSDTATLTCPKCGHEFELAEGLRHQLEEEVREKLQNALGKQQKRLETEFAKRQKELEVREEAAHKLEEHLNKQVATRVKAGLEKQRVEARAEAEADIQEELQRRDERVAKLQEKVKEAQKFEADLRARADELEQEKGQLELDLQRRLGEEKIKLQGQLAEQARSP